jgi:hypothetical protein
MAIVSSPRRGGRLAHRHYLGLGAVIVVTTIGVALQGCRGGSIEFRSAGLGYRSDADACC